MGGREQGGYLGLVEEMQRVHVQCAIDVEVRLAITQEGVGQDLVLQRLEEGGLVRRNEGRGGGAALQGLEDRARVLRVRVGGGQRVQQLGRHGSGSGGEGGKLMKKGTASKGAPRQGQGFRGVSALPHQLPTDGGRGRDERGESRRAAGLCMGKGRSGSRVRKRERGMK